MASISHIQLPSVRTSGVSAAAVAMPAATTPAELGTRSTRKPTRRSSEAMRRTRKHVMMPAVLSGGKRERAGTDAPRKARAASVATSRTSRREDARATRRSRAADRVSARTERAAERAQRGNILQRIHGSLTATPARKWLLVAAVVVGVALYALYPPVRDYYVASRDREVLSARYAELSAEHDGLMHDIGYLQSTEGIEDEARKRGYIIPGETGVTVEGLDEADVAAETEEANDAPWYQGMLDAIFGYVPKEW